MHKKKCLHRSQINYQKKYIPNLKHKQRVTKFLLFFLTQDLQIEQAQKDMHLGISKWSFYNIETNKLVNS